MAGAGTDRSGRKPRPLPKGRAVSARALEEVRAMLGDLPRRRDLLIEHLHKIQDSTGCLSLDHLAALAAELRLAQAEVYEVASFYHHFDIVRDGESPPAPLTVRVCDSIACQLVGAEELKQRLRDLLGREVRVVGASCVGRCDRAPVAMVRHHVVDHATPETVEHACINGYVDPEIPAYVDYAEARRTGGYLLLASCASGERSPEEVMGEVGSSGLRGLGGAGFPSGTKWKYVRDQPGPRTMVLNSDEGEPGTFKDRVILESDPHTVLEGMLIAAWAVEAHECYVYIRDEYPGARRILEREIAALVADPPCPIPAIHLRRGAGAYICGEETALIESIEGKRGEPRLRPPFPAQNGVFGRPTLVHNVETVYWLREILERGPEEFAASGVRGRKGKRLFSVSGRVARPGVYVAPAGVTVRELIDEYAGGMLPGHELYAYLPGGASGGILPASLADLPLDFDVLAKYGCFIGSAAIVVLSDHDRVRDAAVNLMRFFAHESCGKCTPCRVGTAKAVELMSAPSWNTGLLKELGGAMMDASICGLGQAAPNPPRCVINYFPQELQS